MSERKGLLDLYQMRNSQFVPLRTAWRVAMAAASSVHKLDFSGADIVVPKNVGIKRQDRPAALQSAGAVDDKQPKKPVKRKRTGTPVQVAKEDLDKFSRGDAFSVKGVQDKKIRRKIKETEQSFSTAVERAARAQILLPSSGGYLQPEGPMERTWRVQQAEMKEQLDDQSAKKVFDLNLERFGPYTCDYTRNGRFMLLGGRKGHLALMDWSRFSLLHELHVKETVRDVKFLHDQTMFAVAQKKYVYIYDNNGIELHCLRNHVDVEQLEFLPYHWLLVSQGKTGFLKYQDTSTGQLVVEHRTKLGSCSVMRQNPWNAVICCGHGNGRVTMWTPNMSKPVVQMLTHRGPVQALAVDSGGHHLVTAGLDGQVKVWDARTYKQLHAYFSVRPASTLDISHTGMLALGAGPHVQIWKDGLSQKVQSPYMAQKLPGKTTQRVRFCPFEDVLGVSHSQGFSSMVVPGAGEPNFDTFEANPFQDLKQRKENTVHNLLEKLQPEMIALDPSAVARVDERSDAQRKADKEEAEEAKQKEAEANGKTKKKKKKSRSRHSRSNVIDRTTKERKEREAREKAKAEAERKAEARRKSGVPESALDRFKVKRT